MSLETYGDMKHSTHILLKIIPQIFVECFLYARTLINSGRHNREQDKISAFLEFIFC